MKKTGTAHPLAALTHPITIAAVLVILLNAWVLQPHYPSWVTGKIADLAWMIILPLCLAWVFSVSEINTPEKPLLWGLGLSGLVFTLLKTIPLLNHLAASLFYDITHLPLKLTLDASDLLALLGLPIAWWVWHHPRRQSHRTLQIAMISLVALAGLADAPAPGFDQIDCLAVHDNTILAFTPERSSGYLSSSINRKVYISNDNGLTWEDLGVFNDKDGDSEPAPNGLPIYDLMGQCEDWDKLEEINQPDNPDISYMVISGQGVYRSEDAGETYTREYEDTDNVEFEDMVFAPDNQTLIIAGGYKGVLRRASDGTYAWISPGGYDIIED
jgi:hypothetical protein